YEVCLSLAFRPVLFRSVPESVLIGHELAVTLATERVDGAGLVGSERARVGMHFGMIAIRERVLAVELDLVHLPRCQPVDERVERAEARRVGQVWGYWGA